MDDRILNKINMARRCFTCLDKPAHEAIWLNQPPIIFTARVTATRQILNTLLADGGTQETPTTGTTEDKAREEKELEDICYTLARALYRCCHEAGNDTDAAPWKLYPSDWRKLRDEQLLQKARVLATALATTIQANPVTAAQYGIDTLSQSRLLQEAADYEALIGAPDAAIHARSTITTRLPADVRLLLNSLESLDDFIIQFRGTPAGNDFVAEWFLARSILDRGHGPGDPPPTPPPPTP